MARRWKKDVRFYDYQCTLTGEKFRLYHESKNTSELISVKAFYELNPERDDRPEVIKKKLAALEVSQPSLPDSPDSPASEDSEKKSAEDSANDPPADLPSAPPETDEAKPADTKDLPPEKPPTPTA